MLFRDTPGIFVSALAVCLLLAASYCMRVAEAPANRFHSSHFWNNLWFIVVTASTVGYGDNVPSTHLGRLISVVVIIMGTIIISMMTAAATEWLILNQQETLLFEHAKSARSNRRVTESVTAYLQYVWRRGKGKIKEDLVKRNTLR
jgi:NhaP-type Na+/H+ or K+/H+ antiporter